ncbi:LCP family protein [Nocardiopsis sediminis]|uniref:LCP family protein n=1 Tax=Nocardiopsis sediminis TaxID=1778267 RepID=A0ABV8FLL8_9ACTN
MSDRTGDGGRRPDRPEGDPEFRRMRSAPTPPAPPSPSPQRPRTGSGRRTGVAALPGRRVRRKRAAVLVSGALSVLVLLASGTAWAITGWASGQLNRFDVFGGLLDGDRPDAGPRGALNILVIGSDGRDDMERGAQDDLGVGHTPGQRSDTMMLVHLNNERDRVTVVGIPRDSWVDIPGHGTDKINAAYAYGGPQLAVQTVESATNVRIDHYIEVNFTGFVDVVDALGGIEVCLPEAIDDPKANLTMAAGTHRVDGREALAFARTRQTTKGDLDRIERQQQVIAALLDQAVSSDTLGDPQKFAAFLDSALGSITVDEGLDTATINRLGGQLRSIGLDDVSFTQVPIAQMDFWTPRGDVAVVWDEAAAGAMFADIAADRPLGADAEASGGDGGPGDSPSGGDPDAEVAPQDIRLQVFNGMGTPGIGAQARSDLATAGFQVPGQAQDWSSRSVPETVIRYGPGEAAAAQTVADTVPGSTTEEDPTLSDELQVVLGFNYTGVDAATAPAADPSTSPDTGGGTDAPETTTARDNVCAA